MKDPQKTLNQMAIDIRRDAVVALKQGVPAQDVANQLHDIANKIAFAAQLVNEVNGEQWR